MLRICFTGRLLFLFAILLAAPFAQLRAETVYFYDRIYLWTGQDGTGSGSTSQWTDNWSLGNYSITGDGVNPPVLERFEPDDGPNTLRFHYYDNPVSISAGSHSYANTFAEFEIGGTVSGGAFNLAAIQIRTTGNPETGTPYALTFSGTSLESSSSIGIANTQSQLNFSGATVAGKTIGLTGYWYTEFPVTGGDRPTTNLINSLIKAQASGAGLLTISGGSNAAMGVGNDTVLNLTGSVILADKILIGTPGVTSPTEMVLGLKGDEASFIVSPNVTIASTEHEIVSVNLDGSAPKFGPTSIVNIGGSGQAYVTVRNDATFDSATTHLGLQNSGWGQIDLHHAKWTSKDAFIGELGLGLVFADDHSTLTSENVTIGNEMSPHTSIASLDHDSTWTIGKNLHVGERGKAELNVRNGSSINVTQEILAGVEENSLGTIEITSTAPFTAHTTFELGRKGTGIMNIRSGGKVTAESDLILGKEKQGVGTIEVDGGGTELHTTKKLYIGNGQSGYMGNDTNGQGTMTIRNGGKLIADEDVVLGLNGKSRGVLNLIGASASLQLAESAVLTIGKSGVGELNLMQGATFTSMGEVKLGELDGSDGTVRIDGQNSHWNVQGKLTIGDKTRGHVEVVNKGKLTAPAEELQLGNQPESNGKLVVDGDGTEVNVGGNLYIGQRGKGEVEINNKGKLTVPGVGVFIGTQAQGDGSLTIDGDGSLLDFNGRLVVADFGKGNVSLKNGADLSTGDFTLGYFADSEGTLEVLGGTGFTSFIATGDMIAGQSGRGIVRVESAGSLTVQGNLTLGESANSGSSEAPNRVTVAGKDSVLSVQGNLIIGKAANSPSLLQLVGGNSLVATGEYVSIGEGVGSLGVFRLQSFADSSGFYDGVADISGSLRVGVHGRGSLVTEKLTRLTIGGNLLVGGVDQESLGKASFSGEDNRVKVGDNILIGDYGGTAEVIVSASAHLEAGDDIVVNSGLPDRASLTVTGFDFTADDPSKVTYGEMIVAENGWGSLYILDHGSVGSSTANMRVAVESHAIGDVSVDGEGRLQAYDLEIAEQGFATFAISSNGSVSVTNKLSLGESTFTIDHAKVITNEFVVAAGARITLSNSGKIELDPGGSMSLNGTTAKPAMITIESGAALTASDPTAATSRFSAGESGAATVDVRSGGSVGARNIVFGPNATEVHVTGAGSLMNSATLVVNAGASVQVASQAFVQTGRSALINGRIDVHGGTMLVGNVAPETTLPTGAVTVGSGGVLFGKGTIQGNLYGGHSFAGTYNNMPKAKIAPGNSPGILNVEGDVVLDSDVELEMEIGGATPGTQFDQLLATGSMILNGSLTLAIVNSGGGFQLPSVGDAFVLLSAPGGVTAAFQNSAALHSIAGGWLVDWSLSSTGSSAVLQATGITALVDGDYNGDGGVDAADYVVWRKMVGGINLAADGNRDGAIDNLDYDVWRAHFGQIAGSGAGATMNAAVPEPATYLLLMLGVAGWCLRRCGAA